MYFIYREMGVQYTTLSISCKNKMNNIYTLMCVQSCARFDPWTNLSVNHCFITSSLTVKMVVCLSLIWLLQWG
ncbi:hypothetical protein Hanom_Chr12g01110541 [Helianthus anomalus]